MAINYHSKRRLKSFQNRNCVGLAMSTNVHINNKFVRNVDKGDKSFYLDDFRFTNPIGTTSSIILRKDVMQTEEYFHSDIGCRQDYFCWIKVLLKNNGSYFRATSHVGIIYNDDNADDRTSKSRLFFKLFQVVNENQEIEEGNQENQEIEEKPMKNQEKDSRIMNDLKIRFPPGGIGGPAPPRQTVPI